MDIQFIYGAKKGAFASAIMAAALNSGRVLRIKHPFVSFEVDAWADFLKIVWSACADCTRDSRGQEVVKRLPVAINFHGKGFYTEVWFDPETKGLRYASLD
jgi:hypothetical protein